RMTRLWHLLATDVRRHRWLLLLWLFITAGSAATLGLMPMAATDPRSASMAGLLYFLLSCTYATLFVVIVPLVVQTHPAVGSDAFWMTRPIPPQRLFPEKLLLLCAAVAVVPIAADVVLMALYEVPLATSAAVAAQGLFFKSLWIALLMAMAVVTASLPRFAVLCGAVMATIVAAMATSVVWSI